VVAVSLSEFALADSADVRAGQTTIRVNGGFFQFQCGMR
jgi:hypothetical protein